VTSPQHATDFLHDLRRRSAEEGGVFWIDSKRLAVFEPDAARRVNLANWHRFALTDRLIDQLRRRTSPSVRWTEVRTAWFTRLHELTSAPHNARLADRMRQVIDTHLNADLDLVTFAQDVTVRSLLPVVLAGLTEREQQSIISDLDRQLRLLIVRTQDTGRWARWRSLATQIRAGIVVRRVIRQRADGRRPRELDLADPIVDLLPRLGADRALDVVTTVLTATAGPPGSAATSLLYELARHPGWADRLGAELREVDEAAFHTAPTRAAPITHRFVREVLRLWSPPLILLRPARLAIDLGAAKLEPGHAYLLSPHLIHRDPRRWPDADTFDPDRFLPGAPNGPSGRGSYVPFGWAPKRCPGADIATIQLMALCHLMSTRYRLTVPDPDAVTMVYRFAPVPERFVGRITLR
jgi:cytochrome P450